MLGRTRLVALATTAALAGSVAVMPALASGHSSHSTQAVSAAASTKGTITSKVRGTTADGGTVRGHFTPDRFFVKKGRVFATGTLKATVRDASGALVGKKAKTITAPLHRAHTPGAAGRTTASALATCDILHLVLGPLDLNLLGLKVHLDRVVLDITAQSGAGNLLGNLLCAVAGLLDGTDTLTQLLNISNLLNRILTILG